MGKVVTQQDEQGLSPSLTSGEAAARVLFVDLDGTLVQTDLLHEAVLVLLKQSPWQLLRAAAKLPHGIAAFKRAVGEAVSPEISQLPFREEVLEFVAEQRSLGRKVVLATAADSTWAQGIADELGVFDDILASDGTRNLKGAAKLAAIQAYCREHGCAEFDYLGDSFADLPIWRQAHDVGLVAPSASLSRKVGEFCQPATILGRRRAVALPILAALRPHQWSKNVLVLVPLVTSHNLLQFSMAMAAAIAFACFCFCASAVYVLNDLADVSADRGHPVKRMRPFASGALPVSYGPPMAGILLTLAFGLAALTLPAVFLVVLALYFLATCTYSFFAKRIAILDVLMLAGMYTIRVFAGGTAIEVMVSEWLMAFSLFLFVSLAFAKRYAELERLLRSNQVAANGRGYHVSDIGLIESMGPASGYIAVLVLALYVNSEQMKVLYRNPWPLWMLCPVLMYWISRVWIKAKRGELSEDPIVFAMRDRVSVALGAVAIALLVAASLM